MVSSTKIFSWSVFWNVTVASIVLVRDYSRAVFSNTEVNTEVRISSWTSFWRQGSLTILFSNWKLRINFLTNCTTAPFKLCPPLLAGKYSRLLGPKYNISRLSTSRDRWRATLESLESLNFKFPYLRFCGILLGLLLR